MGEKVIVSACLTGVRCRYDGRDSKSDALKEILKGAEPVPVCPEELGGLPTPRPAAEIRAGDGTAVLAGSAAVLDEQGRDVTPDFMRGAIEALRIGKTAGATRAVLKEKSPSCGVQTIKREGKTIEGPGVFAALLKREGFLLQGL